MEEYRGCRVLVADDDPNVHQSLNAYFKREGYLMLSAYDGEQALRQETEAHPDIIILDIMMPKKDGLQVCREVRKNSNVPIIMLSAKGEEFDKLIGLELGADDYITKPFSPREVVARVKAVLRRMREMHDESRASRVVVDNLEIDMNAFQVKLDGQISPARPRKSKSSGRWPRIRAWYSAGSTCLRPSGAMISWGIRARWTATSSASAPNCASRATIGKSAPFGE